MFCHLQLLFGVEEQYSGELWIIYYIKGKMYLALTTQYIY